MDGQPEGLAAAEAARRLATTGPNEITRGETAPPWRLFLAQFANPLVGLLLAACALSAALREVADAVAIGAILIINAAVGFFQEYRAERAVLAMRALTAPRARVVRDGNTAVIPAREVVPGDVLSLEAGDLVAADARLLVAHALSTNEAALTGESTPSDKSAAAATAGAPLAERSDHVFMGTAVAAGTGLAEVVATGMATELGRIAHLIEAVEQQETPLQRRLAEVGRTLLVLCLAVVALVAALGLLRGQPWLDVLLAAVALAVAAVPEGLPAVVTIALAVGVQRMAARHVLVRRLPAVETLGCATVICTDKTGTLTTGVMIVREIVARDETRMLDASAACCDAELSADGRTGVGDPTEVALLAAAAQRGIHRGAIERDRPRRQVQPFDSQRRLMSILRADGVLYVKGASEAVLARTAPGAERDEAARESARLAARGLRVLAVAVGRGGRESELELLGLVGIADPPRPEAIAAIAAARRAGITTTMITGDHPATAEAIAREMGILTGDGATDGQVHARATPEDKLRVVRDLKARGAVVAMTGDGVNDAPALREAHIGIAMGKTGTEVSREASDMVLANDDFASIVAAIREGRAIFDNIRKTLVYLLAGNTGELLVMLAASLAGAPLPLLPLHLLWINLVTDGLPALALVMDPPADDVLVRPPRAPGEPMLGRREWLGVVAIGLVESGTTLGVYLWILQSGDLVRARDMAFLVIVFAELLRAFASRSGTRLLWEIGFFTNGRLIAVVLLSIAAQIGLHLLPASRALFRLADLGPADYAAALAFGLVPATAIELRKIVMRLFSRQHA